MIGRKRKRLGDLLVDAGVVTSEQLGEALKKQRELGLKLGETLIELKFTDENEIVEALHQQMGYPIAKIREAKIAPEVISLLPETIVRKHNVVPFEVDPDNPNILRVAMADPMDIIAIDDLAIVTNMQIEAMVATPSDVRFGIERYYGNEQVAKMAETYSKERREQQNAREKQEEANEEAKKWVELIKNAQIGIYPEIHISNGKDELADYIKANYDRNSMVRAIKYCREQTGWGLKETKEYVEKCILN